MTRSDLIRALAARHPHLTLANAEHVVDTIFCGIAGGLARGSRVELRGFGAFSLRERDERMGRNPRNGARVYVPAKRVPFFRAGKALADRLNDGQA
jgi:integration host factor subunit beta